MEELSKSIPKFLRESGFSNVLTIQPSVIDSTLKIVTSPTNDCLYEVRGNKISNSLKLNGEIKKVGYAYLIENGQLVLFYAVLTSMKFFIVKRFDSRLEVIKEWNDVKDFHLADFMCLGYPQIKMDFGSSSMTIKFPIDDVKKCVGKANPIAVNLAEQLQAVYGHVQELSAEWNRMRILLQENINLEDSNTFPVRSLKFSSPFEQRSADVIVTSTGKFMLQDKLILKMTIQNKSEKELSDLRFKIYEKNIKEYSYSFYSSDFWEMKGNDFFSTRSEPASVAPQNLILVIGAIPTAQLKFAFGTKLAITCWVSSGKLKDYLVKKTFEVTFKDVLVNNSQTLYEVPKKILSTLRVIKTETKLKIQAKYLTRRKLAEILQNDLELEVMLKDTCFFSRSPYLNDVFLCIRGESVDENLLRIVLYTSDDSQVYYLVSVLLEFLPEYATILYDEDE